MDAIKQFGISKERDEGSARYFIKHMLEGITTGRMMVDTYADLNYASEYEVEDLLEDLKEQNKYLSNSTNKTFMQQLDETIQDAILDSKNLLLQADFRYEHLSSGKLTKDRGLISSIIENEDGITWDSTKHIALLGLYKYFKLIEVLIEEAEKDENIIKILSKEDMESIKSFRELMEEERDMFEELDLKDEEYTNIIKIQYLDSDDEDSDYNEDDEAGDISTYISFDALL